MCVSPSIVFLFSSVSLFCCCLTNGASLLRHLLLAVVYEVLGNAVPRLDTIVAGPSGFERRTCTHGHNVAIYDPHRKKGRFQLADSGWI